MRIIVLILIILTALPADAALYQKTAPGVFVLMSPQDEATARADPNALFSNDSGYEVLLSSADAAATRAIWATDAAAQQKAVIVSQAAAAILGGVTITSGNATLNGTYACDPPTQGYIMSEMLSLLVNGVFTNGAPSKGWPDQSGALHSFDAPHFKDFATQIGKYIDAVLVARGMQLSGQPAAWPSNQVTIQ